MTNAARLLVVEDDSDIAGLVADMLAAHGYSVRTLPDGRDLERTLRREPIDLVILDIMLPGEDGLSLCRRLRATTRVPMLMLTALGSLPDRVIGLETGADDYLTKPFAPRELLARVRALLRRTGDTPPPSPEEGPAAYRFEGWVLDLVRRTLRMPDGALVPLTSGEFALLAALCARAGEVIAREQLMARANGPLLAHDRSIDGAIGRLRRKLSQQAGAPAELIRTVRHAGYIFSAEVERLARAP